MRPYSYYILLLALFTACIKSTDIELPSIESKIVVNSIFHPDSLFHVNLTYSYSEYHGEERDTVITTWIQGDQYRDKGFDYIKNATVDLYENGQFVETLPHIRTGNYASDTFTPKPGSTYKIVVTADGKKVVAESYLPYPVGFELISHEIKKNTTDDNLPPDDLLYVTLALKDPKGIENYYMFRAEVKQGYWKGKYKSFHQIDDPLLGYWRPRASFGIMVANDQMINGVDYQFEVVHDDWGIANRSQDFYFYYHLHAISKDLHDHIKSLNKQKASLGFYTEPVQIESNIEGGLGVFAGMSTSVDSLVLKRQ